MLISMQITQPCRVKVCYWNHAATTRFAATPALVGTLAIVVVAKGRFKLAQDYYRQS